MTKNGAFSKNRQKDQLQLPVESRKPILMETNLPKGLVDVACAKPLSPTQGVDGLVYPWETITVLDRHSIDFSQVYAKPVSGIAGVVCLFN